MVELWGVSVRSFGIYLLLLGERNNRSGRFGSERYGRQITAGTAYSLSGVRTQSWWRTYQDSLPKNFHCCIFNQSSSEHYQCRWVVIFGQYRIAQHHLLWLAIALFLRFLFVKPLEFDKPAYSWRPHTLEGGMES